LTTEQRLLELDPARVVAVPAGHHRGFRRR
jgi:hypothetical protein